MSKQKIKIFPVSRIPEFNLTSFWVNTMTEPFDAPVKIDAITITPTVFNYKSPEIKIRKGD